MLNSTSSAPFETRWYGSWLAAFAIFLFAAATGSLMRFGNIYGFPWGLQWGNIRHAHSHLMYFGWVTPALMILIGLWLPKMTERPLSTPLRHISWLTMLTGLLAYVPFLLYGYQRAPIGADGLPLSVIMSGVNVLVWYLFAALYWRETRHLKGKRPLPLHLWDMAVLFLILATVGAVGLPILTFQGIRDPFWSVAFTHIFLDLFSEGWLVLATLGLIHALVPQSASHRWAKLSSDLMVMGLPVVFLLYMPSHIVPPTVRGVGSVGGLLVGLGLAGQMVVLWRSAPPHWRVPLTFLGLKTAGVFLVLLPAVNRWAELNRLRVSYLHWLLLGFVSLSLVYAARAMWGKTAVAHRRLFTVAVVLLIASLIPLTGLWPTAWSGRWVLHVAAWATLVPITVGLIMLANGWKTARRRTN